MVLLCSALTAPHSQPTLGLMSTDLTSAADFCHFCYVSLKWGDTNVSPCQLLTETPRRDTAVPYSTWKHMSANTHFWQHSFLTPERGTDWLCPAGACLAHRTQGNSIMHIVIAAFLKKQHKLWGQEVKIPLILLIIPPLSCWLSTLVISLAEELM